MTLALDSAVLYGNYRYLKLILVGKRAVKEEAVNEVIAAFTCSSQTS